MRPLTPHTKKLIGAIITLIWLPVYALAAAAVAVHVLPGANWLVELAYYMVAGTLWIMPIGLMLPWMHREPKA